jgi:hypothetical protein
MQGGVAAAPKKKYLVTMNNFKNLLIAILTGLLALSLFTQPAQSAPKTYDALKLAQYSTCLQLTKDGKNESTGRLYMRTDLAMAEVLAACNYLKP